MKRVKGFVWMSAIALGILVLLGWIIWQNARMFNIVDSTESSTVMLEGAYSLDGGEEQPIDNEKPIDTHFKKAVFRGKLIENLEFYTIMNVYSKHVWYTLYDKSGEVLCSYQPLMSDTPGYKVNQVYLPELLEKAV